MYESAYKCGVFVLRQGGLVEAHDEEVQSMDVPARDVLSLHSRRPLGRVSIQNPIHRTDSSCCSDKHHIINAQVFHRCGG